MNRGIEQPISLKDQWEIRKDKALTFAGIATPLIVAVIGGMYNANIKESDNRIRYVELAITQLRTAPSTETAALRAWAVELLASQSPIPLPPAAKEQLKANSLSAIVASGTGVSSGSGTISVTTEKATTSHR